MVDRDLQKQCESESELSAAIRKIITVSQMVKEEYAMMHTIEKEIEDVHSCAHNPDEARERLSQILLTCPARIRKKAQKIIMKVRANFVKGKNRQGVPYSSIGADDEGMGDDEQINI